VCINASLTGSLDKVVLEAMACSRPVLSCNDSFPRVVASLGKPAEQLCFAPAVSRDLAAKLRALLDMAPDDRQILTARLRGIVARQHGLQTLVPALVRDMERPK
jgi:glycosyltransferase involved in cell wall biosynthesis